MKLKSITFGFENCEIITIDGKYIGDFLVDDIRTSVSRIACNSVERMDTTYTFAIEIHKNANQEYSIFGEADQKRMTFDRLQVPDITSIEFELENPYEDGSATEHYYYWVHWTGDNECFNDSEKSYISENGHLYIVISENEEIKDYFDMNVINNADEIGFKMSMYDIENNM